MMNASKIAALDTIAHKMMATSDGAGGGSYRDMADEFFGDAVAYTADLVKVIGADAFNVALETFEQVGFGSVVAANLARAVAIELDTKGRCDEDYILCVARSLAG